MCAISNKQVTCNLGDQEVLDKFVASHREELVCGPRTDIVVEGFPRSSNTYVVDMLVSISRRSLGRQLKFANHTHQPQQLYLAKKHQKPLVVLIRNPRDAIVSFMLYSGKSVEECAQHYVDFYSHAACIDYRKAIIPFELVIRDFSRVVEAINQLLPFSLEMPTDADYAYAGEEPFRRANKRGMTEEDRVRKLAIPSDKRDAMKPKVRRQVEEYLHRAKSVVETYELVIESSI